ncbi:MAG: hypothetical protein CMK23_05695 [Porticoccaceae bacterium]|nr:hypothetical protein [Porticoccaceae bacterium]|tara:strand:+ start:1658 stop:2077 length:420 start_codon:yes stop_codon:yes gene_type:complete
MSEYREAALSFEAVKIGMTQNKDGIILRLAVHPQECPPALHTDFVGQRYGVALVALADDETPKHGPELEEIKKLKASAGALPRDTDFQVFLGAESEDAATDILRTKLGIQSRTEFDTNADARVAFVKLREDFQLWLKRR